MSIARIFIFSRVTRKKKEEKIESFVMLSVLLCYNGWNGQRKPDMNWEFLGKRSGMVKLCLSLGTIAAAP